MDANTFQLKDLIKKIDDGELQIPDFQRGWVWDDKQIKSLIESVIRGFPINSIMLLECDAANKKFSCKPIEGVTTSTAPSYLILDGQQRLTSLYGALRSQAPVKFTDGDERYYYLDMKKAVESIKNSVNVENMIISVPANKKAKFGDKTLDLSTPEKEYAANMFPLNQLFKSGWIVKYTLRNPSEEKFIEDFQELVLNACPGYEVVYVKLEKTTPIAVVCKIFEKVNTGGTELTVFELLTAILAAYPDVKINLPADWRQIQKKFSTVPNSSVLSVVNSTYFVTALTLLATYENSGRKNPACTRDDILNLKGSDYLKYRDYIVEGFLAAAKFLDDQSIRLKDYLPYPTQFIPLAAIFAELKLRGITPITDKIRQWYWCGVFGESYRAAQETRYGRDISEITAWFDSGILPKIINETQMSALRLMRLKTRTSAAYKGVMSLIFKVDAKDFITGEDMSTSAAYMEKIDVHHIFPKNYCKEREFNADAVDSVANRTPILSRTNKIIGDNAPSKYLDKIEALSGHSGKDVDTFLESHLADAVFCRADNFDAFVVDRAKKILNKIEQFTGRPISDRDSQDIVTIFGASLA